MYAYMALHVPPFPCLTPLPACSLSTPPCPSSQLLQVRDLSGEAMRLSALYPGGNAKGIMAKQEVINTAWESLTLAIQGRKKMLRSSLEFQKFLSSVRMKTLNYNCFTSAVHSVIGPSISRMHRSVTTFPGCTTWRLLLSRMNQPRVSQEQRSNWEGTSSTEWVQEAEYVAFCRILLVLQ